jgi:hypothetical protein
MCREPVGGRQRAKFDGKSEKELGAIRPSPTVGALRPGWQPINLGMTWHSKTGDLRLICKRIEEMVNRAASFTGSFRVPSR